MQTESEVRARLDKLVSPPVADNEWQYLLVTEKVQTVLDAWDAANQADDLKYLARDLKAFREAMKIAEKAEAPARSRSTLKRTRKPPRLPLDLSEASEARAEAENEFALLLAGFDPRVRSARSLVGGPLDRDAALTLIASGVSAVLPRRAPDGVRLEAEWPEPAAGEGSPRGIRVAVRVRITSDSEWLALPEFSLTSLYMPWFLLGRERQVFESGDALIRWDERGRRELLAVAGPEPSLLGQLIDYAKAVAADYGWDEWNTLSFLIENRKPASHGIRGYLDARSAPWDAKSRVRTQGRIHLEVDPWMPSSEVAAVYQDLRRLHMPSSTRKRPISAKTARLVAFVLADISRSLFEVRRGAREKLAGRGTWARHMRAWNEAHPEEPYAHPGMFHRDFDRGLEALSWAIADEDDKEADDGER